MLIEETAPDRNNTKRIKDRTFVYFTHELQKADFSFAFVKRRPKTIYNPKNVALDNDWRMRLGETVLGNIDVTKNKYLFEKLQVYYNNVDEPAYMAKVNQVRSLFGYKEKDNGMVVDLRKFNIVLKEPENNEDSNFLLSGEDDAKNERIKKEAKIVDLY